MEYAKFQPLTFTPNPSLKTNLKKTSEKTWSEIRYDQSILRTFGKGLEMEIPLIWHAVVNDFAHEINLLRKNLDLKVTQKIHITVFQLDDVQNVALYNEEAYIKESCLISRLDLFKMEDKFFLFKGYNNHMITLSTYEINEEKTKSIEKFIEITVDISHDRSDI